eukprot:1146976-Pelagomonas_calceolata.AAC.4
MERAPKGCVVQLSCSLMRPQVTKAENFVVVGDSSEDELYFEEYKDYLTVHHALYCIVLYQQLDSATDACRSVSAH